MELYGYNQFMKTYFIRTYGCQQNERDSEEIETILVNSRLKKASSWRKSDLLVLNSCSVRQASEDKIYGLGREVNLLREKGNNIKVIVTGCMVGSTLGSRKRFSYKTLENRLSWVDYILPQSQIQRLPEILYSLGLIHEIKPDITKGSLHLISKGLKHAYVNISVGCDNFCTYCVVPYARGAEVSRSKGDILKEIDELVTSGITEVTFLGQNVNSWNLNKEEKFKIRSGSNKKLPFTSLLREVHNISEITKISFLSSNPFDFTNDLVDVLALEKMDRYVHIAVQSGDDEILKKMNRRHTAVEFISLIKKIRERVPEIHIGTDIIVGFPGETKEAFENTVKLCEEVKFNVAFVSIYSAREGTAAAKLKDNILKSEKKKRHQRLLKVIEDSKS